MTKKDLIELILKNPTTIIRENYFSKHFIKFYQEIQNIKYPLDFKFSQKLYHYIHNDYELNLGICPTCGKYCKFISLPVGYTKYCSQKCINQSEKTKQMQNTNLKKFGVKMASMLPEYKEKQKQTHKENTGYDYPMQNEQTKIKSQETCLEKYGTKNASQSEQVKQKSKNTKLEKYNDIHYNNREKYKQTCLEKYGVINTTQLKEVQQKMKQTCLENFGVDSYSKTQEFKDKLSENNKDRVNKIFETKKENNTINSSKPENELYNWFTSNNIQVLTQYKSELYPYHCDFYLPDYDLYIEIQGTWTHGGHPFDKNNIEDINKLNKWIEKAKESDYYNKAINDWTVRDVKKRTCAILNKLNYLEIFSDNINEIISQIKKYTLTIHQEEQ